MKGSAFLTGIAVFTLAAPAQAAPPKVQGKYAVMTFTQCLAHITTPTQQFLKQPAGSGSANAITHLNTAGAGLGGGELNIGVGVITFTTAGNAPASSGSATISLNHVRGSALRINGGGPAMATATETLTGTFQILAVAGNANIFTFRFDPNGANPPGPMSWTLVPSDFAAGGLARNAYLVQREDATCLNGINVSKQ